MKKQNLVLKLVKEINLDFIDKKYYYSS